MVMRVAAGWGEVGRKIMKRRMFSQGQYLNSLLVFIPQTLSELNKVISVFSMQGMDTRPQHLMFLCAHTVYSRLAAQPWGNDIYVCSWVWGRQSYDSFADRHMASLFSPSVMLQVAAI